MPSGGLSSILTLPSFLGANRHKRLSPTPWARKHPLSVIDPLVILRHRLNMGAPEQRRVHGGRDEAFLEGAGLDFLALPQNA